MITPISMDPRVWGPHGWFFLHSIAANYPNKPTAKNRKDYYNFFMSVGKVLPCKVCQSNYAKHFVILPIQLSNRRKLLRWTYDMHDLVRKSNGKTSPPFREVAKKFIG